MFVRPTLNLRWSFPPSGASQPPWIIYPRPREFPPYNARLFAPRKLYVCITFGKVVGKYTSGRVCIYYRCIVMLNKISTATEKRSNVPFKCCSRPPRHQNVQYQRSNVLYGFYMNYLLCILQLTFMTIYLQICYLIF